MTGKAARAQPVGEKQADKKAAAEEKTYVFEMRAKPWSSVFEWLAEKAGRPFIAASTPSGTITFINQKGTKYTIPQIIDIINDGLIKQKWILLNRDSSFTVVPTDERIDPALVPRVKLADLDRHGLTEIVSTLYPCKSLVAENMGHEVKKEMGPFGEVVILHQANLLLLQDTVVNFSSVFINWLDSLRRQWPLAKIPG